MYQNNAFFLIFEIQERYIPGKYLGLLHLPRSVQIKAQEFKQELFHDYERSLPNMYSLLVFAWILSFFWN